jgi:CRP/FNR family transcriptional regulator, cyclic AMP receptor protein
MIDYTADLHSRCFPFLDPRAAGLLFAEMEWVDLPAGARLYGRDEPADGLYLLTSGRLAVHHRSGFADRQQVVALLDPGAPVAEAGLLPDSRHGATVTAAEESRLALLPRAAYQRLAAVEPALAVALLQWLLGRTALRLRKNSERLAQVL